MVGVVPGASRRVGPRVEMRDWVLVLDDRKVDVHKRRAQGQGHSHDQFMSV